LKISNIILSFIVSSSLYAQDLSLSQDRQNILKYSYEKAKEDSAKLSKNWIEPIRYSYTYNDGDNIDKSKNSLISISQPIFRSGGIYSAIKYASAINNSNTLSINLEEKELIKKSTEILFNIYKNKLLIKKQKLILSNNLIDISQKEESVLNGLLDISFLNNAILENNKQQKNLLELEFQNINLTNSFNNFTSKLPSEFKLPTLKLLDNKTYLENNIYIKQSIATTKTKQHFKEIVKAKYLPTVNANYSYINNHIINKANDTYGFSVVIPLNIGMFNDMSSSKISFLKSKSQEKVTSRVENNFLKTVLAKIDMINKKIALTKDNINAFNSLLIQMKERQELGLKTNDDVLILENSKKAEALDIKIFTIDKQLELLELYARVEDVI
jgi:hypothetical protein